MILEWREELEKNSQFEIQKVEQYWNEKFKPFTILNPEISFYKYIKKYGLIEVLDCIDIAYTTYFFGKYEHAETSLYRLGGILYNRSRQ